MTQPTGPRPYFIPPGLDYDALSSELKLAIAEIIVPAYKQMVLGARDALERATGISFVHLLWLEILDQFDLGRQVDAAGDAKAREERRAAIDRHLRLLGAKGKVANFLLRISEFATRTGLLPGPPMPWPTTSTPPGQPAPDDLPPTAF